MRFNSKTVIDIATGEIISRETFEYTGPVAQAFSSGSSKSKSQSQSTQESGTKFNEDFLNQAFNYFNPKRTTGGGFDAAKYLQDNPDVAASPYASNPYQHYLDYGKNEGRAAPMAPGEQAFTGPDYNPQYQKGAYAPGAYTGAAYTPVDGGDFNKIESNLYGSQQARLGKAYNENVARQREELSQSGALNSPAQFLEGSARSSLDKGYLDSLQQAARDASTTALGLKQQEAARRTGFDVGEATRRTGYDVGEGTRRTAYDVGEATRGTEFNVDTQTKLMQLFLAKLQAAIESGKFGTQQSTAYGTGGGSQFGLVTFGPSSSGSSSSGSGSSKP